MDWKKAKKIEDLPKFLFPKQNKKTKQWTYSDREILTLNTDGEFDVCSVELFETEKGFEFRLLDGRANAVGFPLLYCNLRVPKMFNETIEGMMRGKNEESKH